MAQRVRSEKGRKRAGRPRHKAVVRRLPPHLPEDVFWESVAPWVRGAGNAREASDDAPATVDYAVYVPGIKSGEHAYWSTAYMRFLNTPALLTFYKEFEGHMYKDKKGAEYVAAVEYAPIQLAPSGRKGPADTQSGTIEKMPEYKAFVASLEQAPAAAEPEAEVVQDTTPLLDYLQKKQADDAARARKQREAAKAKKKGKPEMDKVVILKPVRKDDEPPAQGQPAPASQPPPAPKAPAKSKAKGSKDKDPKPRDPKPKDPKLRDPKKGPKPKDPPMPPKPNPEDGANPQAKPTHPGVIAIPEAHNPSPTPGRGAPRGRRGRGRGRGRGT